MWSELLLTLLLYMAHTFTLFYFTLSRSRQISGTFNFDRTELLCKLMAEEVISLFFVGYG